MTDFVGMPGDDDFTGTGQRDTFDMSQGGDDTVNGRLGNDFFSFGGALTAADTIIGGPGRDTLALDGDYSARLTFSPTTMTGVQRIALAGGNSYNLALDDANVAAGHVLTIDGRSLFAGDTLRFHGEAETNGSFLVKGGVGDDRVSTGMSGDTMFGEGGSDRLSGNAGGDTIHGNGGLDILRGGIGADTMFGDVGNDTLIGGRGIDLLAGGRGADTFVFHDVSELTNRLYDTLDEFNVHRDNINLNVAVDDMDATLTTGSLSDGRTYVHDFQRAIDDTVLAAHHAVVWIPDEGTDAGDIYVVVDANGSAGFQKGADYIIELEDPKHLNDLDAGIFT